MTVATQTALTGITTVDYFGIKTPIPVFKEQVKIADMFSNLDTQIEVIDKQITQNQSFKKGLLQQMFV